MQVPKRKSARFTYLKNDPYITLSKYQELQKKLQKLRQQIQPKLAKEVMRLAEFGDFSENAAYQIAKGKLRYVNSQIDKLTALINEAIIIEKSKNSQVVSLGSRVTVKSNNKKFIFEILGSSQTAPEKGIISHNSPIGKALLGHRVGESVIVLLAKKQQVYKIEAIS